MTSYEAYLHCKEVEDTKKIRRLITNSYHAYFYCRYVKDRKSMRKLIASDVFINELDRIKLNKKDS